ncbi:hypothetical protein OSTOST_03135 [Ostertagia ostertagi]
MSFKVAIRLTVKTRNTQPRRVAMLVRKSHDDMIVSRTNALGTFNLLLKEDHNSVASTKSQQGRDRPLRRSRLNKNRTLQKGNFRIYLSTQQTSNRIPVTNTLYQPQIFRAGEEVGSWDTSSIVERPPAEHSNMLERTCRSIPEREQELWQLLCQRKQNTENDKLLRDLIEQFSDVFAVSDQELSELCKILADLPERNIIKRIVRDFARSQNQKARERMKKYYDVSERPFAVGERVYMRVPIKRLRQLIQSSQMNGTDPFRIIEVSDNSALIASLAGNVEPLEIQFDLFKRLPLGLDDEPVQTVKQRTKRGVDVGPPQEDPLHLFHPCTCNIFRTKAQTALPSLRSDLARSKPVNNMFELANCSIHSGGSTQGGRASQQGLKTLDSLGASSCDRRSSFKLLHLQHRVEKCSWETHHSSFAVSLFSRKPTRTTHNPNPTIVALPLSFIRAEKVLEENDKVSITVYSTLDGLAVQLNSCSISAAVVLVWPNVIPSTVYLDHVMHALKRHLQ